jgi:hypothetical protein
VVGVDLNIVSHVRIYDIHYRHTGARGLPPRGQTIDCWMYPAASASLERCDAEDFLPVFWGNSGSSAEAPEAKYCCTPS